MYWSGLSFLWPDVCHCSASNQDGKNKGMLPQSWKWWCCTGQLQCRASAAPEQFCSSLQRVRKTLKSSEKGASCACHCKYTAWVAIKLKPWFHVSSLCWITGFQAKNGQNKTCSWHLGEVTWGCLQRYWRLQELDGADTSSFSTSSTWMWVIRGFIATSFHIVVRYFKQN